MSQKNIIERIVRCKINQKVCINTLFKINLKESRADKKYVPINIYFLCYRKNELEFKHEIKNSLSKRPKNLHIKHFDLWTLYIPFIKPFCFDTKINQKVSVLKLLHIPLRNDFLTLELHIHVKKIKL